jgi:hypothetical protein
MCGIFGWGMVLADQVLFVVACDFLLQQPGGWRRAPLSRRRNDRLAEVVSGLSEGDRVILHPSDRITDGVVVEERPN